MAIAMGFNADKSPTLSGVVRVRARYVKTLKKMTPVNPINASGTKAFSGGNSFLSEIHTVGIKTTQIC